jgi:hypothetical protein
MLEEGPRRMAQLPKSKKGVKKRGPSPSQKVAEQRDRYWKATFQQLEEAGLSDVDLRVLSPTDEYPETQELGKLYVESFEKAYQLEKELIAIIKASTFDANSRKIVIQSIRDYGKAQERHGAIATQYEFRGVDQYQRAIAGKNRGSAKRNQGPREPRLALMMQWLERNDGSRDKLSSKTDEIAKWMRQRNHKVVLPVDARTWERDWEDVFRRRGARKTGDSE